MKTFIKDPDEVLDYSFDWGTAWLGSDSIADSDWALDPDTDGELAIAESPTPSFDDETTTVWLEGGVAGERYLLTNSIETAAGRYADRSVWIKIVSRR